MSRGLRELADSIQKYGLLNPILVRPEPDGTFTTLAGSRRLKACRQLGRKGKDEGYRQLTWKVKRSAAKGNASKALVKSVATLFRKWSL